MSKLSTCRLASEQDHRDAIERMKASIRQGDKKLFKEFINFGGEYTIVHIEDNKLNKCAMAYMLDIWGLSVIAACETVQHAPEGNKV